MKIETFTAAIPSMSTSLIFGFMVSLVVAIVHLITLKKRYSRQFYRLERKDIVVTLLIVLGVVIGFTSAHKIGAQTFYAQAKMNYSDKQEALLADSGFLIKDVQKPVLMNNSSWYSAFPDETEEAVMVLTHKGKDYTCDVKPQVNGFLEFACNPGNLSLEDIKALG